MLFTPVDGKMNKENDDGPLDAQTKPYSKDMNHPKHIAIPGSSSMKKHMSLFHQGFVWWVFFFLGKCQIQKTSTDLISG